MGSLSRRCGGSWMQGVQSMRSQSALGNSGSKTVAPQAVTWSSGSEPSLKSRRATGTETAPDGVLGADARTYFHLSSVERFCDNGAVSGHLHRRSSCVALLPPSNKTLDRRDEYWVPRFGTRFSTSWAQLVPRCTTLEVGLFACLLPFGDRPLLQANPIIVRDKTAMGRS